MNRLVTWARLSFALQRWELLLVAGGALLLAAAMLWIAWQVQRVVAIDPTCFPMESAGAGCGQALERFNVLADMGNRLLYFSFGAPFGMGLLLGVPLVAREVDHGTAAMAWTLSRSRTRWLASRVAFVALVVIGLLALISVASDVMAQAMRPDLSLAADFTWYGRRGGLIVMRGLLALAVGLSIGALLGRQLPALLVAIFATIALFTAISLGMDRLLLAEAQRVRLSALGSNDTSFSGARSLGGFFETPGGALLTFGDLEARGYTGGIWEEDGAIYANPADVAAKRNVIAWNVQLLVPGRRYPEVVVRESAVLGGSALLVGGLAFAVVRRRRPY